MTEEETTDRILAALTEGERLAGSVFAEADRMVATVRLIEGGLAGLPLSTDQFGTANGHELVWLRAKKAVTVFTGDVGGTRWLECAAGVKMATFPLLLPLVEAAVATLQPGWRADGCHHASTGLPGGRP
jgi:hypothetical protein